MLRPIGTKFDITYPPSLSETGRTYTHCFTTITYEVVAHTKTIQFIGDEEGVLVEELKVIDVKKIPAKCVIVDDKLKFEKEEK